MKKVEEKFYSLFVTIVLYFLSIKKRFLLFKN